jgi:hypothetical protein
VKGIILKKGDICEDNNTKNGYRDTYPHAAFHELCINTGAPDNK